MRTTLGEAIKLYEEQSPRGEFVLILEGGCPKEEEEISLESALERVNALIGQGLSKKDAVKQAAKETGFPKNALYDAAMK